MNWKPIPGYEGFYEVSDEGQIRSLDRVDRRGRFWKSQLLRPGTTPRGHHYVALRRDGKLKTFLLHVLVARAFLGPCPEGHEVCHNDGIGTNNHINNLSYGSRRKNVAIDRNRHPNNYSSKYPGVCRRKGRKRSPWQAGITFEGRSMHLGVFESEEDAAQAYLEAFEAAERGELKAYLDARKKLS